MSIQALALLVSSKGELAFGQTSALLSVVQSQGRVQLFVTPQPARLLCPWDSPGKNTGVGCHFLLQGIFLIQGLNPGLLHSRQILDQLSHQGSPPHQMPASERKQTYLSTNLDCLLAFEQRAARPHLLVTNPGTGCANALIKSVPGNKAVGQLCSILSFLEKLFFFQSLDLFV